MNRCRKVFFACCAVFLALAACSDDDGPDYTGLLAADLALLDGAALGYAAGDSAVRVTTNVSLPLSGTNGSTIGWSSTNSGVVVTGNTATFLRPGPQEGDSTVYLTATLSNGSAVTNRVLPLILHHLPGWRTIAVTEKRSGGSIGNYPLPLACNGSGEIFLAYNSTSYDNGIFVCKLVGTNLTPLGGDVNNLEGAIAHAFILDASGNPVLAFRDYANSYRAEVRRYSGSAWDPVGSAGLSTGGAYWNVLASGNGLLYHGCQDTVDGKVWVRAWDGTNWSVLGGAAVSSGSGDQIDMAVDGDGRPWVVYRDADTYSKLGVMRHTGSNWMAVGPATPSLWLGEYPSLLHRQNGNMTAAFLDCQPYPTRVVRVVEWTGTGWSTLGQAITNEINQTTLAESPSGVLHLGYIPAGDQITRVVRLDGNQWVPLPAAGLPVTNTYASRLLFDNDGRLWMATTDSALGYRVRLMRYVE